MLVGSAACASRSEVLAGQQPRSLNPPSRIILFIADGGGIAHWSAGYLSALADDQKLAVTSFPVVGLIDPANTTRPKPESASAATGFATGVRSYYEAIGVGPDSLPRETVLELAERRGMATGVVTTTLLVDATPAAFLAHTASRGDRKEIAEQIAAQPVEVLMGDGRQWFDGTLGQGSTDFLSELRSRFVLVETGAALRAIDPDTVEALLGFFPSDAGRDPSARDPSIAEMTRTALQILDRDPDGFFLLVENEHTDHATHENLPLPIVAGEIRALDDAVRVALDYRERHPETLVIVAADHETGGLSLVPTEAGMEAHYGWNDHTVTLVPLFAVGPGSASFGGIHPNEDIGRLLMEIVAADSMVAAEHSPTADPE
jgi:alkaline phosphatase